MSKICQSCGMPMSKPHDHGTIANGSKSQEYCAFCFQDGRFVDDGITLREKIEKNIPIAKRMGMQEAKAREMAEKTLPKLKRWKK